MYPFKSIDSRHTQSSTFVNTQIATSDILLSAITTSMATICLRKMWSLNLKKLQKVKNYANLNLKKIKKKPC